MSLASISYTILVYLLILNISGYLGISYYLFLVGLFAIHPYSLSSIRPFLSSAYPYLLFLPTLYCLISITDFSFLIDFVFYTFIIFSASRFFASSSHSLRYVSRFVSINSLIIVFGAQLLVQICQIFFLFPVPPYVDLQPNSFDLSLNFLARAPGIFLRSNSSELGLISLLPIFIFIPLFFGRRFSKFPILVSILLCICTINVFNGGRISFLILCFLLISLIGYVASRLLLYLFNRFRIRLFILYFLTFFVIASLIIWSSSPLISLINREQFMFSDSNPVSFFQDLYTANQSRYLLWIHLDSFSDLFTGKDVPYEAVNSDSFIVKSIVSFGLLLTIIFFLLTVSLALSFFDVSVPLSVFVIFILIIFNIKTQLIPSAFFLQCSLVIAFCNIVYHKLLKESHSI